MAVPQDNPAGRLHDVLSRLKECVEGSLIDDALAEVLGLTEGRTEALLHEYAAVVAAWPLETRRLVEGMDANHELYLSWVEPVRNATAWIGRWSQVLENLTNQYNETHLVALAFTSELLHSQQPEAMIEEDKLPGLVDLVREIIDEVTEDQELTAEARAFLLRHLLEVERALVHFRVVGYAGVEDAMDRFLGATFRTPAVRNEHTRNWFSRIWGGIHGALIGTKQLGDSAQSAMKALETGKDLFGL